MIRTIAVIALAAAFATPAAAQDVSLDPTFESVTLSAGFDEDPHQVQMIAGGDINAERLGGACVGFIANAPDVTLDYTAGDYTLSIGAIGNGADTTIAINGPDGEWYCDDDSFEDGDPIFHFRNPQSGYYDIYVGTFESGTEVPVTLVITEMLDE